jgi:OB-fold nucleic acid binding domain
MPMRKFVEKFTKPVDEQDREKLVTWCTERGGVPIDCLQLRQPVHIAGEIRSVRIAPRAGAASLEATVQDGRGSVTAVFLGRRKIAGLSPGRRVLLEGVVTKHKSSSNGSSPGNDFLMYNPVYQLL